MSSTYRTWAWLVLGFWLAGLCLGHAQTVTYSPSFAATQFAGGRCTLTTVTPVMTAAINNATTLFYTPYLHQFVPLYDGTRFNMRDTGGELSNITSNSATGSAGPAVVANNSNYDLFVWDNAGTVTFTRGPLWSSDTARGSGAGTTQLSRVNGVWLNTVAITNGPAASRGTYVCTVRSNGTATLDMSFGGTAAGGTAGLLNVWNYYNRVNTRCGSVDSTASWNYTSSTVRSANNSTGNRCSYVSGLAEETYQARYSALMTFTAAAAARGIVGVGLDVTSTYDYIWQGTNNLNVAYDVTARAEGWYGANIGFHFIQAVERGDNTNALTFTGSSTAGGIELVTRQ